MAKKESKYAYTEPNDYLPPDLMKILKEGVEDGSKKTSKKSTTKKKSTGTKKKK